VNPGLFLCQRLNIVLVGNAFTNRENRQITVDSVTSTNDAIEITITARRA
jgi:hypothetical protein